MLPVVKKVLSISKYSRYKDMGKISWLDFVGGLIEIKITVSVGEIQACACEHQIKITWSLFILIKEDIHSIFLSFHLFVPLHAK